jgi:hypothetical protein
MAEISESHLAAFPLGHEFTQNVMLFPVRFGLLFRQRNVEYLVGRGGRSFNTSFRVRRRPMDRMDQLSLDLVGRSRQREALSSMWARAAELARQHGLYSNGTNSASGLLPPEEVSAIDRPRSKDG